MSETGFAADWPSPPGVRTWQTTRHGGVSRAAYASLNLATHVGDTAEAVAANRARLREACDLPCERVWLDQVHEARVLHIDRGEGGPADAAVTTEVGQPLVVMTADCLPVLLAASDGSAVGVAHAGWRGLAAGVIEAAVAALQTHPAGLIAWLGPAIGPSAFEVGDEVREAYVRRDPALGDAFEPNSRGRWQADLFALARAALEQAGVSDVFGGGVCTFSDAGTWFSHRREAPCGRMATLIWRQ